MANLPMTRIVKRLITHNPNFAQTHVDLIALSVFILGGHLALWFEWCHVIPYYHGKSPTSYVYVHRSIAVLLYIYTFTNLYFLINSPSTGSHLELCNKREDSWRYCTDCQLYAPPRCHHCKICRVCVLKRDHHCWFTGCCVGYANYRYYFCMVLSVSIAAIYANIYHADFILVNMGGFSISTIFCIIFPHMAGMLGYLTLYQFFIALMGFVAILCGILFTWLLSLQCIHLYNGQTEFERKCNRKDFNLGLMGNLKEALGERWYLVGFFPWINSSLPGDGTSFTVTRSIKFN